MPKIRYSAVEEIPLDKLVIHKDNFMRDVPDDEQKAFEKQIAEQGVETPIYITKEPDKNGNYEILNGARRFRASKKAKFSTIPCKRVLTDLTDWVRARVMVAGNDWAKNYSPENRKQVIQIWFKEIEIIQDERGGAFGNQYSSVREFKTPLRLRIHELFGWPLRTVDRDLSEIRKEIFSKKKKPIKELPDLLDGEILYFNNRVSDWWSSELQKKQLLQDLKNEQDAIKKKITKISETQKKYTRDFKKVGGLQTYVRLAIKKDPALKKIKGLKEFIEEEIKKEKKSK
ncbi:ParB N-terminal domain-containing protein [Leptospira sp. 201903071]|uniref:ParB/RepB/Spo0J family partition protein n=1 Tax=Leptospira ainazelensis TaxID=2810034 RepID=UPI00196489E2|nr:ParB N-terminal domain-containing protein [Leptospira ainazelensis]MBM9499687.1 ParB N-terminal domain-containing protein [Leptospira ainazelensis]